MNFDYNTIRLITVQLDKLCNILIYPTLGLISIMTALILLSVPVSSLLDSEADFNKREREKERSRPRRMDLYYLRNTLGERPLVFDRNDPTGASLDALFLHKRYNFVYLNGMRGILIGYAANVVPDPTNPLEKVVKLPSLTGVYVGLLASGVTITSHGAPVMTTTTGRRGCTSTNILIKKD